MDDADNFRAEILKRRERRPFEPFAVVRRDGRRHVVPESLRIAAGERFAILLPPDQSTSETVQFTDIAAIEPAN